LKITVTSILSVFTAFSASSAHAADESATQALKARDAEIRAALPPQGKEVTPETKKKLQAILTKIVDLDAMAKTTLGKHWDTQPADKRKKFVDAFTNAFRNAVGGEIDFYRSSATEFAPERKKADGVVDVPTTLMVKDEPTDIVYTMKKDGAEWRIIDISIDDVSTVETYRASFAKTITKEGIDVLIKKVEKPAS
jgi:phospholipid transport system substrate-binding protein